MKVAWAKFAVTATLAAISSAFNIDTNHPILASPSSNYENSFFGYSIVIKDSSLYVGAPGHEGTGGVFRCDFDGSTVDKQVTLCSKIPVSAIRIPFGTHQRYFIGASVGTTGDKVFACAPRYNSEKYWQLSDVTGACFKMSSGLRREFDIKHELPRRNLGVMGHSVIDDGRGGLVIGTPMARTFSSERSDERTTGHILLAKFLGGSSSYSIPQREKVPWSEDNHASEMDPHAYDFTGTSVTRGRFFFDRQKIHYAVGAPKADHLRGRVYLCPDCFSESSSSSFLRSGIFFPHDSLTLNGRHFGERFGHSVCAVNLDGDIFDDLVVGAPLYSEKNGLHDIGTVYVFRTTVVGYQTQMTPVSFSLRRKKQPGAKFGATVANVGDLDGDRYEDFAVAAPFENKGQGAVYIYRGAAGVILADEEPQKLTPSGIGQSPMAMKGFGMSISGRVDIDANAMMDLAIGSFDSGNAVVLRTLKVMRLKPSSTVETVPNGAIEPSDNGFTIIVRPSVAKDNPMRLIYQVQVVTKDKRLEQPSSGKLKQYSPSAEERVRVSASLYQFGATEDGNMLQHPLRFDVIIKWTLSETGCPPLGCPVLDPREKHNELFNRSVSLKSGCENNDRCLCDMSLSYENGDAAITIGEDNEIEKTVRVENSGSEPAYNAKLLIQTDQMITPPRQCTTSLESSESRIGYMYECSLPPIFAKKSLSVPMVFDISKWSNISFDYVNLSFKLRGSCGSQSTGSTKFDKDVGIEFKYEISIAPEENSSSQKQLQFNNTDIQFRQMFWITNNGPSPQNELFEFTAYVPKTDLLELEQFSSTEASTSSSGVDPALLKSVPSCRRYNGRRFSTSGRLKVPLANSGEMFSCSTVSCHIIDCKIAPFSLGSGQSIPFALNMLFRSEAANERESRRFAFRSLMQRKRAAADQDFAASTTEFYSIDLALNVALAESWHYIAGGLAGLILVVVLVAALWKAGVFSRVRIFKKHLDAEEEMARRASQPRRAVQS